MSTTNLALGLIASNQASKEVTANAALVGLDKASNSALTIAMSDANYNLTAAQLASAQVFVFDGTLTAQREILVPILNTAGNPMQRLFVVSNNTNHALMVTTVAGFGVLVEPGTASPYVPVYQMVFLDGTNVQAVDQSGSASLPASGVTPGSYTLSDLTINAAGIITAASNGSGGGGSAATSLMISNSNGGSNTTNTQYFAGYSSGVRFDYFVLPCAVTFSHITAYISQGNFTGHTSDIGIYSLTGTLLCSVGSGLVIAYGAAWNVFNMQAPVTLPAGGYFLATTSQDGTEVIMGYGNNAISPYQNGIVANTVTGYVLPATATVPGSALTGTNAAYWPYPQFYLS
jgi:hypothetical protein